MCMKLSLPSFKNFSKIIVLYEFNISASLTWFKYSINLTILIQMLTFNKPNIINF